MFYPAVFSSVVFNRKNCSYPVNAHYAHYAHLKLFPLPHTIDVEGVGRVRLVGINTPERDEPGYQNATDFVKSKVLGKTVCLDIDDMKNQDKYGRILAVIYIDDVNLNKELLKRGYAKIMYIPPSEFNPYSWT